MCLPMFDFLSVYLFIRLPVCLKVLYLPIYGYTYLTVDICQNACECVCYAHLYYARLDESGFWWLLFALN